MLGSLGFGHVEIGSVSAQPSDGNPRPRLFRIPEDRGIVVAYGVPNEGADAVAARLAGSRVRARLGVNLVKTNDPARPAVEPDVYEDYAASLARLQDRADYVALNLSCPNSAADRDFFDDLPRIDRLLAALGEVGVRRPLFLKLKPTQDAGVLREIVAIADGHPFVSGFAINLPAGKPDDARDPRDAARAAGRRCPARSAARRSRRSSTTSSRTLHGIAGDRYALVAAGGVASAESAYRKLQLGASLVQLYTGLVYRGPRVVTEILRGLVELLERDGHATVADAVGSAAR